MKRCDAGKTELETRCEFFAQFVVVADQCHESAEDRLTCFKHIGVFIHQGDDCTGSLVRPFVEEF